MSSLIFIVMDLDSSRTYACRMR